MKAVQGYDIPSCFVAYVKMIHIEYSNLICHNMLIPFNINYICYSYALFLLYIIFFSFIPLIAGQAEGTTVTMGN